MAEYTPPAHDLDSYEQFVEFYDQAVMGAYLQQSDRFAVETDHFEGRLSSRYDKETTLKDAVDIRFGYRTLSNGDLAIAAFRPDLYQKSTAHIPRWSPFRLTKAKWASEDERYARWLRRYLDGDWRVDNGPRAQLEAVIKTINALTTETVGMDLFSSHECAALTFPLAQNTHRYQDAHQVLYGYLIDGLQKGCIVRIGTKVGLNLNTASDKTFAALRKLPSIPGDSSPLWAALDNTSLQRGLVGHKVRPTASRFAAFEVFSGDLEGWVAGLQQLLASLENMLGMRGAMAEKRQSAKAFLPPIVGPGGNPLANPQRLVGKTITRIEYGTQEVHETLHRGEAMVLHFTDGSSLGIHTGSNAQSLARSHDLKPPEIHVDLILQWVPGPGEDESEP